MTRSPKLPAHCWLLGVAAFLLSVAASASAANLAESQLRVRFLHNFLRFTEWPPGAFVSSGARMQLCILGAVDHPLEDALSQLQDAVVGGRKVDIRSSVAPEDAAECHLLYVPDRELPRLQSARDSIGRRPVLIVGESEVALDRGAMIAMRLVNRHLAFVIKHSALGPTDLKCSPQMLNAASEILP